MYKLSFFVPLTHAEKVKEAIFLAGAGRIGNYDCCSWEVVGVGQFRPLKGSQPFLGRQNQIEHVDELKVETVCEDDLIRVVIQALRQAHPYEEPAFDVWKLETL